MTEHKDFKRSVRERMRKTGERYTAARAVLLAAGEPRAARAWTIPGLFPGYAPMGGICPDTGALRNLLAASGVTAPHTGRAPSEALVAGLCGGVGFLYAVFEYKGWPPMLSVLCRYDTMSDGYVAGAIARLGVRATVHETASAAAARKALDAAVAARRPALLVVDATAFATSGEEGPGAMAGMAPRVVVVAGVDGDDLLVDDGGATPRRVPLDEMARARALYKKGKHRLVTIEGETTGDVREAVRAAVAATARRYVEAPYRGFASNFGFAGLEKWLRLLTDRKDKKGWSTLFPEGRLAYLALHRAYDGIEHEYTAPAAGRPLYAAFLAEAAELTGEARLATAAAHYRRAGEAWRALSEAIAGCGDAAVAKGCAIGDSARELFDEAPCDQAREATLLSGRAALAASCALTKDAAAAVYQRLAERLADVLEIEREAVAAMGGGQAQA